MQDLIAILKRTAEDNRTSRYQRIAEEESRLQKRQEEQAEILCYTDSGYRCKLLTGEIILATAISNAGLYKGAIVSLVRCPDSLAIIDSMPR